MHKNRAVLIHPFEEKVKEKKSSNEPHAVCVISPSPDNLILINRFDVRKEQLIISAAHIKVIDGNPCVVPTRESKFSILKRAKQQSNKKAINHELRMLNLLGKSEAKTPIDLFGVKYIPMRKEGKINLSQAIAGKKDLSLILNCLHKSVQKLVDLHKKNIMHMDIASHNLMFPSGEWVDFECSLMVESKTGYAKMPSYLFDKYSLSEQDDLPIKCFPYYESGKKIVSAIADCFLLSDMLAELLYVISTNYKNCSQLPFLNNAFKEIIALISEADYQTNSIKLLEEISDAFEFINNTFQRLTSPKIGLFFQSKHNLKNQENAVEQHSNGM